MSVYGETLPDDFSASPKLEAAWKVWKKWCGGRSVPTWADVDLMLLPPKLLPFATVMDVLDDGRYRYRFWGTGIANAYEVEVTGKLLEEAFGGEFFGVTKRQLDSVVESGEPQLYRTIIEKPSGARLIKINLRLPVMDMPDQITKVITVSTLERVGIHDYESVGEIWGTSKLVAGQRVNDGGA